MLSRDLLGDIPKTYRFLTGSPFNFGETKRILLGLIQLVDRDADRIDWSKKDKLRTAFRAICEAAEEVERDLEHDLRMALYDADEATEDDVLSGRFAEAQEPWRGIGKRITELRLALGDATADRKWRDTLIALRDGKITLRAALCTHASVKYALRCGLIDLRRNLARNRSFQRGARQSLFNPTPNNSKTQLGAVSLNQGEIRLLSKVDTHWLHLLEQNTRLRRLAILQVLKEKVFKNPRGRRVEREVEGFVRRFCDICEECSGTKPTASLHETSITGSYGGKVRASAGILLLQACLEPLGYVLGEARCKDILLTVLSSKD